jgi:multiple sugar transport system substrate-binding protein
VSACGGGAGADQTVTIHWYTAPQNGGSFDAAAKQCTEQANGRYRVEVNPLPADASQQREQLVRRLAANDSSIDLISMDVIWTAEFAEAGWVKPWPKALAQQVSKGAIPAVVKTGHYQGRMYAAPLNTGSQVLFYRKSYVKDPPKTWDEMIDVASKLPAGKRYIQVQGARYEGLTVWFNSMLESAGGHIVDSKGDVSLRQEPTQRALSVMAKLAKGKTADPSLSNNQEDQSRLGFESGDSAFMVNYANMYEGIRKEKPAIKDDIGVALWPRVNPDEPAHVTLGGFNIGVASDTEHSKLAFDAAQCLTGRDRQLLYLKMDGLPPVTEALYQTAEVRKAYPFTDILLETFREGSTRPTSPAYNDISLAVQRSIHPVRSLDPKSAAEDLRSTVDDAINSRGLL